MLGRYYCPDRICRAKPGEHHSPNCYVDREYDSGEPWDGRFLKYHNDAFLFALWQKGGEPCSRSPDDPDVRLDVSEAEAILYRYPRVQLDKLRRAAKKGQIPIELGVEARHARWTRHQERKERLEGTGSPRPSGAWGGR